ncbi:FdhF/YdeP family oxidoreductase [Candidatus Poseidonia alphae]|nr:FdhF/YdeP family oxidoreductase [Candidatus Poseidonia alphae]MDA8759581.1 FdhF/YdeP family oxidoreductase [Candidatus Poseidonia alphae]
MERHVTSRTPDDTNALRLKKPKTKAAGIPAVLSSAKHGLAKMGLAKTIKNLTMVNQKEGFDCPGCAWPDPEHRTTFEFCENGAKAVADEAMKAHVTPHFFSKHSVSELSQLSDYELNRKGRISHPVILEKGALHYTKISWKDAFSRISDHLKSISDPNRTAFYTSGRTSNEAAFLYQAFVRAYGTNNLPDCSNMCHESSGKGLGQTIGIGKGTVTLDDFNHADVIMVIGQNPGTNHPRMLTALRDAKHKGAKIIHVNPLPEAGLMQFKHPQDYMKGDLKSTTLADLHLGVRIGGDAALIKGLIKVQVDRQAIDQEFVTSKTTGMDEMISKAASTSWKQITKDSGISKSDIQVAGTMLANSKATIACWAMGLTQHRNGVAVIQEIVNLLLLGGHVGKKGAGFCPVRGHSNVQGDRTVGIWEAPTDAFLDRLQEGLGFEVPREHGHDVVNAIDAMVRSDIDFFFCMGGNFLSATPDTDVTARGLSKIPLTVQVSTKLNRSHLVTGETAIILPCLGRTELDVQGGVKQFVTVENSMGVVHRSQGGLQPASTSLRSEPWIVAELAESTLGIEHLEWRVLGQDYSKIRDLMEQSLFGFDQYNERVNSPNGFELPNPPRDSQSFSTQDGKAHFTAHDLPNLEVDDDQYVMMTLRSHDQYNTTIYGLSDRYRGVKGNRRVVFMNATDMVERGWKARTKVNITSHFKGEKRHSENWLIVPYDIPSGNIATYFPEANSLVPLHSTAEQSNTPTSKWIVCSMSTSDTIRGEEE